MPLTSIQLTNGTAFDEVKLAEVVRRLAPICEEFDLAVDTSVILPDVQVRIRQDTDGYNPRDNDNVAVLFIPRNRYVSGDDGAANPREMNPDDILLRMPIYAYTHSGVMISLKPFSCPWDSGQCGEAYVTKAKAKEEGYENDVDWARRMIEAEVWEYGDYVEGNVWRVTVYNEMQHGIESMGGFLGDTLEKTGILSEFGEELHEKIKQAWEGRHESAFE